MSPAGHLRPWAPGWRSSPYMGHCHCHDRWKKEFVDWCNSSNDSAQKWHTSLLLWGQNEPHGLYLIIREINPPIRKGATGHMSKPRWQRSEMILSHGEAADIGNNNIIDKKFSTLFQSNLLIILWLMKFVLFKKIFYDFSKIIEFYSKNFLWFLVKALCI